MVSNQPIKTFEIMPPEMMAEIFDIGNPICPFHKYVGNRSAVNIALRIAKRAFTTVADIIGTDIEVSTREYPLRMLITGRKSVGKTTFARCYAKLVGTDYFTGDQLQPYVEIDGTQIKKPEQVMDAIRVSVEAAGLPLELEEEVGQIKHYSLPPLVLFIDEVHRLPMAVQEGLLKMSEPGDGVFRIGNNRIDCRKIAIIIGTTKPGKLDRPFHSRFPIKIELKEHSLDDLTTIIMNENQHWDRVTAHRLARLRPVPREALDIARLVNATQETESCSLPKALSVIANDLGLSDGCVSQRGYEVLLALSQTPAGLSKKNLCSVCDMDETEFENDLLPQLLRNQFHKALISIGSRHKITEAGMSELKKRGLKED